MAAGPSRPRIDERAIGAGTNVRFALLVVLLLVASGSWILDVASGLFGSGAFGCSLAAGADPNDGADLATSLNQVLQEDAYEACLDRYQRSAPGWVIVAWPALVLAVAGVLFWGLPAWKGRRGRAVPLEAVDRDGEIRTAVERLATEIGLPRVPRVVVDPSAASTGAVVFGSSGRPTVCLYGGLLTGRTADPEGFRAVVLHELAHIRNGDTTVTYATIAVWRAFLATVLLPYLAWYVLQFTQGIQSPFWPSYAPTVTRNLVLGVFLVMLIYLARSDVLRSREIHADLTAVRHGADPRSWDLAAPGQNQGAMRRALGSFVELWRSHPRWDLRRESLADPAELFGVRALPMFLTGAAITLINVEIRSYLRDYDLGLFGLAGPWPVQAMQILAGPALVTGVAGIALWRAVAYAVLTSRPVPSGVWPGVWLGGGMAAGELAMGESTINQWLPTRAEVLGLVVLAGTVFTWWTAQSAQLWIRTWRGRTIRPAMLLSLGAATLALASWYLWWQFQGVLLTAGVQVAPDALRQTLAQEYPTVAANHPLMVSAIHVALSELSLLYHWPLLFTAIAALWVVPLLAWVFRPGTTTSSWVSRALRNSEHRELPAEPLPPLRRVLLPGFLGGVLCWAAVAGVQAAMHRWPLDQRNGLYLQIYLMWMLVAMVAVAAVAALSAGALAGRYRLLIALIAAHSATLVGYAGTFVLASVDGCIQPLSTIHLQTYCAWRPSSTWSITSPYLALTLPLSTIVAVAAAVAVSALRKAWRPKPRRADAGRPSGDEPSRMTVPDRWAGRTCVAAVVLTTALAVTAWPWEPDFTGSSSAPLDPASRQRIARSMHQDTDTAAASDQTRTIQVAAWRDHGGNDLLDRFGDHWDRLATALPERAAWDQPGRIDLSRVRPICADISRTARDAGTYFQIPDVQGQRLWEKLITQAEGASRDCVRAINQGNRELFLRSIGKLTEAADTGTKVYRRVDAVSRSGLP